VREGAEYFTELGSTAQRRYEALRAYFTEEMPAAEVADRFGYSTASVRQMATLLRKGRLRLFAEARPGPKGPRKAAGQLRARVLELRAAGHSVTEIAAACTREGMPVSAQTCWLILDVPRRSQRTRAVLTFFAQDHATADMVYANADITKAEQAAEIIAFADYWQQATGSDPGLLVFDSQLTTYKVLAELSGRGIRWLTLRQRGKTELTRLAELPAREWKAAIIARAGRYRRPRLHEDMIKLTDISAKVRQIAVTNIGRDEPTLIITNDLTTPGKNLFARYAERMMIENELDAYIGGFHLDALTSGVPLNVDLDTTLTVVAGNLYRLLALKLSRYQRATPQTLWRDFLDATGTLHIDDTGVTCALNLRSHHPALIDAGFADLQTPIPWWGGRVLRFRFPPR
jgi:transposase